MESEKWEFMATKNIDKDIVYLEIYDPDKQTVLRCLGKRICDAGVASLLSYPYGGLELSNGQDHQFIIAEPWDERLQDFVLSDIIYRVPFNQESEDYLLNLVIKKFKDIACEIIGFSEEESKAVTVEEIDIREGDEHGI